MPSSISKLVFMPLHFIAQQLFNIDFFFKNSILKSRLCIQLIILPFVLSRQRNNKSDSFKLGYRSKYLIIVYASLLTINYLTLCLLISLFIFLFILYIYLTSIALWPLGIVVSFQVSFLTIALISLSIVFLYFSFSCSFMKVY